MSGNNTLVMKQGGVHDVTCIQSVCHRRVDSAAFFSFSSILLVTVTGAVLALLLLFLRGPVRVVGVILLCVCWGVGIAQYRLQQIAALVT